MPTVEVRLAQEADLPAIKAVLAETWHDTYDHTLGRAWISRSRSRR